jgi:electron transport complex protein RnfE
MTDTSYSRVAMDGLWHNNTGLVQLLGLCPLLAVTGTAINGLGLGLATTAALVASNVTVSSIRHVVPPEVRLPVFVLVIASIVTVIELGMNAYFHELYKILGIFIPLIVTNCALIGRAEAFASKHSVGYALVDGLTIGLGFTGVLFVLGSMRELVGQGTLLSQAHLMFGDTARWLSITVFEHYRGFLLAILPPGAFLGLGLLIALKNIIDERARRRQTVPVSVATEGEMPVAGGAA